MKQIAAIYLPDGEPFSPYRGGALATWTHEVYVRMSGTINSFVIANGDVSPYPAPPLRICAANRVIARLARLCRNRRWRGTLEPWKMFMRQSHARCAARICRDLGAGIIHIHNDPEAVIPIRRCNPTATVVLHMNNDHLIEGHVSESASAAVQAADWIAFCSRHVMEGALQTVRGLRQDRCLVIHNGAELSAEPDWTGSKFKSEKGPVLLFVGRIVRQKGLHVLLDAMPQVLEHFPSATLRIVGGVHFGSHAVDPYLAELRSKAAGLSGRIEFVGPVSHTEIHLHFQNADVFACPSVWNDPFPLVTLEAMGAGVPVVSFAKGGIPEAVGDAGILVKETDPDSLALMLIRLLNNHDLRRELSIRGRQRVAEHFTWDMIASQWRARLEEWQEQGNYRSLLLT